MDSAALKLVRRTKNGRPFLIIVAARDIQKGEMAAMKGIKIGRGTERLAMWVIDDQHTGEVDETDMEGNEMILYKTAHDALISTPTWEELKNMDIEDRILSTITAMTLGVVPRKPSADAIGNNVEFMGIEEAKERIKAQIAAIEEAYLKAQAAEADMKAKCDRYQADLKALKAKCDRSQADLKATRDERGRYQADLKALMATRDELE